MIMTEIESPVNKYIDVYINNYVRQFRNFITSNYIVNIGGVAGFIATDDGSVTILGDLTIHANNFATLNKKNFTSVTPLKLALNFLILALNDSAFALVSLSSKKLRILS